MPALVAYGRSWNIASDDFVFPEITEGIVRLIWMTFVIAVFIFHYHLQCSTTDLNIYICGLLIINGITVALAFVIAVISSRGRIMDSRPRRHVASLLYVRLPVYMIEVIWAIVSTCYAFSTSMNTSECHYTTIMRITVFLEWVLIFCVLFGVFIVFNPMHEDSIEDRSLIARRTWSRRFRVFKIRQDALMRSAIDDLANLIASFFQDSDVVFSDVAAGLLLVVHSPTNIYPPIVPVDSDRPSWMTLESAVHFLHFSTCVYGWPTYIMHNCGVSPVMRLIRKMQCCGRLRCDQIRSRWIVWLIKTRSTHRCTRITRVFIRVLLTALISAVIGNMLCPNSKSSVRDFSYEMRSMGSAESSSARQPSDVEAASSAEVEIVGSNPATTGDSAPQPATTGSHKVLVVEDNCCFCNTAAFVLSTQNKSIDLFFVSFRNRLYEVPFVVLADHDTKSTVITIRGSCSLMDLVTDLCLDDEAFSVDVDADPDLRNDTSLDGEGEIRVHRGMLRSARYVFDTIRNNHILEDMYVLNPTYQLVVCGHSLGAGVASLLSLLLKQQYPDVRCYAFSPPGCVISANGQHELEQHVMSVVGGDDVISRISYHSMVRLREKVEAELWSSSKAKYEILMRGVFRLFFSPAWENGPLSGQVTTDRAVLIHDAPNNSMYGSNHNVDRPNSSASRTELYAPGKILHLSEENDIISKAWIDPKCLSDVKLTASAFTDHLPKSLNAMLEKVIQNEDNGEEIVIEIQPR